MILGILVALGSAATPEARCDKTFEKMLPQIKKGWARTSPDLEAAGVRNTPALRDLFMKECVKLSKTDLDCSDVGDNKTEPVKCKGIAKALDAATLNWSMNVLANDPVVQANGRAAATAGRTSYPKEGLEAFTRQCLVTQKKKARADPKAFCECMAGALQDHVSWKDFSANVALHTDNAEYLCEMSP